MTVHSKLAAAMADIVAVGKNQKNTQQGFQYRGIDDVYNAINPILAKHGLFMTSDVLEKSREERTTPKGGILAFTCLRMRYTFWADDATNVSTVVEGEGMDSGDKSSNKAMAVAHKYALLQAFCIPTRDLDDPDAESPELGGEAKGRTVQKPASTKLAPSPAEAKAKEIADKIKSAATVEDIDALWTEAAPHLPALPDAWKQRLEDLKIERAAELTPNAAE